VWCVCARVCVGCVRACVVCVHVWCVRGVCGMCVVCVRVCVVYVVCVRVCARARVCGMCMWCVCGVCECVSVDLVSQHAMRMRHIDICSLPRSTIFSHIIS